MFDNLQNTEFPPCDNFFSKQRSCNTLEAEYTASVNLLKNGLITDQAVTKLKLKKTATNWNGELSVPANGLGAGTNEHV